MGVGEIISTYNRLLKLYKKKKDSRKTPLEDYTTEILVGLLENNPIILKKFINNIMEIPGENFEIQSQRKFYLKDDIDCIVDIVIENEDMICFLENKVNSTEGDRQLERYRKVLNDINIKKNKSVYLRYCTKYYDKKDIVAIDFKQIRWMDIYRFLKMQDDDELIKEYLDFLRSEGMFTAGDFNFQDLIVLSNISYTVSKINECLDSVKESFERDFGKSKKTQNNKFWLYKDKIFGEEYSEIYIGFNVAEDNEKISPYLVCGIYCTNSNSECDRFAKHIENNKKFKYIDISNSRVDAYFDEPLSNFLSSNNQFEDIEKWFFDRLQIIKEFKDSTNDLDWKC